MQSDITTYSTSKLMVIILFTIVMTVDGIAIFMLYTAAFEQQREGLIATARSQAQMINAVARFDKTYSNTENPAGAEGATLSQIRDALKNYIGFGRTGEITLGKLDNNHVIFLIQSRKNDSQTAEPLSVPIPEGSPIAIPMQLALSGKTGTITSIDYRNVEVLAAYEPISELNYGIIAKIDISEIREPFIKAAVITLFIAILMITTGSYFFIKIYNSILQRLRKSESYNRTLFETLPAGLVLSDMQGKLVDVNPTYANIIGRTVEETKKLSYWDITPDDYAESEQSQLKSLETTGHYGPYEKEYFHKNGHRIPVRLNGQIVEIDDIKYIWSIAEDISSRIEIENALANAYELNRKIIHESPVGMAIYDISGQCIEGNEALASMIGATKEQLLQQNYNDIDAWKESGLLDRVRTILITQSKMMFEALFHTSFGKTVYLSCHIVPLNIGQKQHVLLVADDITERKNTEAALIRSEETAAKAQAIANIGNWDWSIESGHLTWTDEIYRIFGLAPQQFNATYDAFLERIHPDDRQSVIDAVDSAVAGKKTYNIEHRIVRPGNELRIVHEQGKVYYDHQSKPLRMIGTVHDITELRKKDDKLKDQVARNELVLSTTQDGYWIVSTDGHIRDANRAYSNMSGFDYNELIGMRISDIDCAQTPEEIAENIAKLTKHGFLKFETRHRCKDKTIIDVEVTVSHAILDGESTVIAFFKDITERKKNEEELNLHRMHLESLVSERTSELKNAQHELIRKERLATLGQLTATVSHELRNPLGAIQPSIYILKKKSDATDTMLQDAIDRIERNVYRCDHIIDELLDFTRIADINLTATDLNQWLVETVNEHAIPDHIDVEYSFNNEIIASFDTDRLRRAIINILDNAIQAIEENRNNLDKLNPNIAIATHKNDGKIIIEIKDNGIGINDEVLDRIFEPLFSTKGFGVGLGMPTVKQIMQQHNGDIDILSARHQGTCVTLWMPAYATDTPNTDT